MAKTETYEATGTLHHDGKTYGPGDPVELTAEAAERLLATSPPAIREPGSADAPPPPAPTTHPLTPQTIPEIEAVLPAIDDADRLRAARDVEETRGGRRAIEARLEDLAESESGDDGGE